MKRTILISGASSGIGRAAARKMLQQGHRVIGISRDCSQFTAINSQFTAVKMDLSNPELLAKQIALVKPQLTDVDAVIFCAGYGQFGSLEEFSYKQIQDLLSVNLISQIFLAKAVIPGLKQKTFGDLIFIGSEAALRGSRKGSVYCAGKFALRGFAQALRDECARSKIRVCIINPGMVKTAFFDKLDFEPGPDRSNYLQPEDVAEAISFVINADPSIVIDEINLNPLNRVVNFKKQ